MIVELNAHTRPKKLNSISVAQINITPAVNGIKDRYNLLLKVSPISLQTTTVKRGVVAFMVCTKEIVAYSIAKLLVTCPNICKIDVGNKQINIL